MTGIVWSERMVSHNETEPGSYSYGKASSEESSTMGEKPDGATPREG